ncbi:ABC transporter fecCD family protein [Candidatus Mycoplasma haematolamae str. Purdue]|uniref:ABC transporter fecCD family protein n=1 Tax=Mycoplasma haematolamae (strain Purdue) TaxID=1212765 RepID=I7C5A6_MYCHA|nr:iron ABC transporter permease [Candidatus Mycoplasma haematolamae]AFO51692.1 ABC transporter fecCD family protein [Candidatus Mycoplasma haematolamae str. Purdue]
MSNVSPYVFDRSAYIYTFRENEIHKSSWAHLLNRQRSITTGLLLLTLSFFTLNLYWQLPKWDFEQALAPLFGVRPLTTGQTGQSSEAKIDLIKFLPYQRIVWIGIASILAAVLLSLSGNVSQSLLQNPLADCSTLGMIDGAAFGLMILKTFLGKSIGAYYWSNFVASFFCSFLVFVLILTLFSRKVAWERKNLCTMIILFGLVLNIFFRASVHLLKQYNTASVSTAFSLAIGGAENIYELFPSQFLFVKVAIPVTIFLFILVRLLARNFNLAELGFDQAHSLGVNIKVLQWVGYFIILCCSTIAINLVGNIAFLGLISTHVARKLFKTRRYETIIPASSVVAAALLMVAITINSLIPAISSSNLILALGAISLFFLTKE